MNPRFIHLKIHSEFSLVDGIVRVKPLVHAAASDGMPAIALTDHMNLFAAVKFYRAAMEHGIKPIFGADLIVKEALDSPDAYLVTLLCLNNLGYLHLTQLLSKAYQEGQVRGSPCVLREWLIGQTEGLLALSGAARGDLGQALLNQQPEQAATFLTFWQQQFPDRFYLELQRVGRADDEILLDCTVDLAVKHRLPTVATNDVRFLSADDFEAHEARVCIHQGYTLADKRRPKIYTEQQGLRTQDEMCALFSDLPDALQNTVEIAKRCTMALKLGEVSLPQFPVPEGMTTESYLVKKSEVGLTDRLTTLFRDDQDALDAVKKTYQDRLQHELAVILSMKFPGYFLIVADFIEWAKAHQVPVGPGRGSGAGSLVAYALGITNLDPIGYELLFERFLNPERVSMPDFDIDFCMEKRDAVIDYVVEKYGRENVSQIITYGTMAARAVVRDVGRVLGHPYGFVDQLAKLIPFELGITLDKALEEDDLNQRYEAEEEVQVLMDLAQKLEGITRNVGKHAGGLVIAPAKLTNFTPLYCEEGSASVMTQFDKDDIEAVGLVKFDFLGLRTLTIIDWAVKMINRLNEDTGKAPIDIEQIALDDPAVYDLLKACTTTAVFQLESRGMKDLIKRLQPDCFEEIIALVALFRPGPLQSGMVDDFINRKHGRAQVEYPHPALEPILRPTYGVILYQEQVMQIAQELAGYTLGGADLLRRAMGKKKAKEMAKQRSVFVEGASQRGVESKTATYIFDLMEKFAGYGFNKSHSAAYALVAYQTAWLKTHYPAAFMAAVLSSDMDNTDKIVIFIEECRALSINVLPPDINSSHYRFDVNENDDIIYGLGAIKGVGYAALESLFAVREQGPFTSLFDFCRRVDLRKVNRRVLEALIRSGAMDSLGAHRASQLAIVDDALRDAEQHAKNQACGQNDLFGLGDDTSETSGLTYPDVPPLVEEDCLLGEKETLGFYFSGHPLDQLRDELSHYTQAPIARITPLHGETVNIAGLVTALRTMLTKRQDRMAFVTLGDQTGQIEIAVFSDVYAEAKALLVKDQCLIVSGEVSVDNYTGGYKMSATTICSLEQARERYTEYLLLDLSADQAAPTLIEKIQTVLREFSTGQCPVRLGYAKPEGRVLFPLSQAWKVNPSNALLRRLRELLGDEAVSFQFR